MDPVSAIIGGISSIADTIGGGPQARAEEARQKTLQAQQAAAVAATQADTYKTYALYAVVAVLGVAGVFLISKAVT